MENLRHQDDAKEVIRQDDNGNIDEIARDEDGGQQPSWFFPEPENALFGGKPGGLNGLELVAVQRKERDL